MSITAVTRDVPSRPPRVRDQARDAITLVLFSAAMSAGITATLFLLMHVGR